MNRFLRLPQILSVALVGMIASRAGAADPSAVVAAPSAPLTVGVGPLAPTSQVSAPVRDEEIFTSDLSNRTDYPLLQNNALAYRVSTWGSLFTPSERAALSTASDVWKAGTAMERADSAVALTKNERASTGSAYAGAISSSLVFNPGSSTDAWPALISMVSPKASVSRVLSRQWVPMATDWTERSRGATRGDYGDGTIAWVAQVVAILPSPHGSNSWRAGTSAFRIGTLSALSGDWPSMGRMGEAEVSKFCGLWARRALGAMLTSELGVLMAPRASVRNGIVMSAPTRPTPPVTLNYSF